MNTKILFPLILLAWSVFYTPSACSQAYTPKDDHEILELLPVAASERKQLKALKFQASENPGDYRTAINLAQKYIALGRSNADPRYYGYAEALLKPWLTPQKKHPEALILRATLLQNRHEFQLALADLKMALKIDPRLPQAWLTLAAIYEVQGDYPSALRSCLALARYSTSLEATACIHSALSLSGQAQSSYQKLLASASNTQVDPEASTWIYTLLAELAERLNLVIEADNWYRQAIAQNYRSVYSLTSYSDYLLDQNRNNEVIKLLDGETRSDALLLRLTLAEQRLQHPNLNPHLSLILDKIAAAKARGDNVHQGDEARFNLYLQNNSATALKLAASNWAVQKEPRDARIYLEAAIAAKQPEQALPVIKFLEKTRLQDARLEPLLKRVRR